MHGENTWACWCVLCMCVCVYVHCLCVFVCICECTLRFYVHVCLASVGACARMHACTSAYDCWYLLLFVICFTFLYFLFPYPLPLFFFLWSLFLGTLFLHCFSGFSVFDRSLNYVKDFQSKPAKKLNTRCPPSWDNLHYKSMWINRDQRLKVLVSEVCTGTEMYGRCKIWSTTVDWKCQIQNQDIPK